MAISSLIKAAKKVGMKKSTAKKVGMRKPIAEKLKTFESELKNIQGMALKDETRNNKLLQLYKKYGKKIPAKLAKPVQRKEGGRTGSLLGTTLKEQKDQKKIKKGKSISAKEGGRTGSLLGTILKEQKDQKKTKKGKSISAKKGGKIGSAPHNRLY